MKRTLLILLSLVFVSSLADSQLMRRRTGGAPQFQPTDLSNLTVWIDGSDASTLFEDTGKTTPATNNNAPIKAQADKSGNNNDALASANWPLLALNQQNGKNGIAYATNGMLATITQISGFNTSSFTMFFVAKQSSMANNLENGLLKINNYNNGLWIEKDSWSSGAFAIFNNNVLFILEVIPKAQTTPKIFTVQKTYGSEFKIHVNTADSAVSTNATLCGTFTNGNINIGMSQRSWGSIIYEVLIYTRVLSYEERYSVWQYLNTKWAIY